MFQRNNPTPGVKPKPARSGGSGLSFIGPELVVNGDLTTDAQLHIDGRVDGNVTCSHLIQGNAGIVAGNIMADEARLAGTVEGMVTARTLTIEATARIMGDVAYDVISIEAGAQIEGRLARRAALGFEAEDRGGLVATPVSFSPAARTEAEPDIMFALPGSASTHEAAE
jgi:cytoskeletal protein CcmA (bactofilin family)